MINVQAGSIRIHWHSGLAFRFKYDVDVVVFTCSTRTRNVEKSQDFFTYEYNYSSLNETHFRSTIKYMLYLIQYSMRKKSLDTVLFVIPLRVCACTVPRIMPL